MKPTRSLLSLTLLLLSVALILGSCDREPTDSVTDAATESGTETLTPNSEETSSEAPTEAVTEEDTEPVMVEIIKAGQKRAT